MAPPKKKRCRREHDLSIYGVQRYTPDGRKDGRYCAECKRITDRAFAKRKYVNDKIIKIWEELSSGEEQDSEVDSRGEGG